jgi:NodT family efflux transporter outer membrane factor (OMF) lipoprotein
MKKAWLLLALLSSCGGPYKAKDVAISDAFINPIALRDSKNFNPCFWQILEDTTLNRLVDLVVSQNFSYLASVEKINQMRAMYSLEKSKLYPTIRGTGFTARTRNSRTSNFFSNPNGPPYGNLYGLGFDASWELDLFGSQLAAKQSAFFNVMTQVEKASYMKLSLISELVMQYISLRSNQAQIKLYQTQINILKSLEAISNSRFTSGLNDQTNTLSNLARIQDKQALVEKMQTEVSSLIFSITKLTGQFPDKEYEELSQFKELKVDLPLIYPDLPSELILHRPDVKQARFNLFSKQAALKKAYRDFFPNFSLSSLWGFVSNYSNQLLKSKSIEWAIIPGFNVTLIDFGALISAKNSAKSEEKQALLAYEDTLIEAFSEIETALAGVKFSDQEIKAYGQELAYLEEKSLEIKQRFSAGLIDKSKYLESYLEELLLQENLINAIKSRYNYAISFYKALGVVP